MRRDKNLVEVDAVNVVAALNSDTNSLGDAMFLIQEIKALCKEVGVRPFKAIPREPNSLAHKLANLPFSSGEELLWRDTDLHCIFPDL
ncbi:hypothetical protein LWI28_028854 [Acer negundo]|uniref:RNase H type-1 domain-containing protein n=1 Tax=Acer negundo TaxID=4023 RepID=A0AAD5IL67_ACENE|nr:hypothetical protein LWI28_028854 [Acer negundo]KAK4839787.1 hypothetical protein QYF36_024942 [Acer negundo]